MVRLKLVRWTLSLAVISSLLLIIVNLWDIFPAPRRWPKTLRGKPKSVGELSQTTPTPSVYHRESPSNVQTIGKEFLEETRRQLQIQNDMNRLFNLERSGSMSVNDTYRRIKNHAIARLGYDRLMHHKANDPTTPIGSKVNVSEASQILLVTTWRSGSTFVGELMAQIPGTFYNFEPLIYFHRIGHMANSTVKANYLRDIFKCNIPQNLLDSSNNRPSKPATHSR